jgi:hypothetical protein
MTGLGCLSIEPFVQALQGVARVGVFSPAIPYHDFSFSLHGSPLLHVPSSDVDLIPRRHLGLIPPPHDFPAVKVIAGVLRNSTDISTSLIF